MSLDYMNNKNSKYKAFGGFIFGGSASIGTMKAGFHVDRILEMTDDMLELNAYHFNKNFNEIDMILPKQWENKDYLQSVSKENFDFSYFNCPCSSLSQLNRQASVDGKNNIHFYRVFNIIKESKPKTFLIENAPTLIKLGYPILQDMFNELGDIYKFTIIRDYAGNHNVAMKRMRTLVVGWKKDEFNNKIPLLHMNKQKTTTTKDAIGDLYDVEVNSQTVKNFVTLNDYWDAADLYSKVPQNTSTLLALIEQWDNVKDQIEDTTIINEVEKAKQKLESGKRIWDKTPWRVGEKNQCPSMTSLTKLVHPVKNRSFTIREYARLMNYPDDFEFFPDECKVDIIQCIAQGVPANFIEYIASEIRETLEGNREFIEDSEDKLLCFEYNTQKVYKTYTREELNEIKCLDSDKTFNKLEK